MFSIVTALFNQVGYTQTFFESIRKYSTQPYELIVVNNGSSDTTRSWLKTQKIDNLIDWPINQGTTKAWNAGIKQAKHPYICVLNNDLIVGPRWMDGLLETLRNAPADLATLSPSCNGITHSINAENNAQSRKMFAIEASYIQSQPASLWPHSLIGSAIVIPRSTINTIGLFDERYFAWYNDLDYNLQIVAHGLKAYTTSKSTIYHFGGASSHDEYLKNIKEKDKNAFLAKWCQMKAFLDQYYAAV